MKESGRKQGAASPCAACKLLRRRCAQDCVFAPYFPADEPQKFANVHRVFGASNVNKMLQELPVHQRGDAVSSMVYEANARVRDPVYGCVGAISLLQQQIDTLQTQLALAQAEVVHLQVRQTASFSHHGFGPASPSNSGSPSSKLMRSQDKTTFDVDMMVNQDKKRGGSDSGGAVATVMVVRVT
ncbi:LOB domain-containing protein 3 [Hibiscus syriacus]|uniref:LOB domain-containing protein 3 n=1 Tax=Hibiscus syriacus TaxID=106335 RepID=A0A6A3BFH1_HIBSY|nr:LOB domain-containing protein 3 [Hibiscus syriacus]